MLVFVLVLPDFGTSSTARAFAILKIFGLHFPWIQQFDWLKYFWPIRKRAGLVTKPRNIYIFVVFQNNLEKDFCNLLYFLALVFV
jgi:hypothetical protein